METTVCVTGSADRHVQDVHRGSFERAWRLLCVLQVLPTDMFKMFIEDRLNERVDYWSEYEMKTRPWAKKAGLVDSSSIPNRTK